jgi:hypothetical protein
VNAVASPINDQFPTGHLVVAENSVKSRTPVLIPAPNFAASR